MKKKYRIIPVLAMALALIIGGSVSAMAESTTYDEECRYNGSRIVSSFTGKTVAEAVSNLQPGDDVTFNVTYINASGVDTNWYMENAIARTLEKSANKKVSGTGQAENGGYTYELIHYDKDGKEKVLFSNEKVGGDNGTVENLKKSGDDLTGLEPATSALDDWFFIQSLAGSDSPDGYESGKVVLHVAFDGETEVNDYMDTDGELNVRFAVEKNPEPDKPKPTPPSTRIDTGDVSHLMMWAVICLVSGILLFVIAFIIIKRRGENDEQAE